MPELEIQLKLFSSSTKITYLDQRLCKDFLHLHGLAQAGPGWKALYDQGSDRMTHHIYEAELREEKLPVNSQSFKESFDGKELQKKPVFQRSKPRLPFNSRLNQPNDQLACLSFVPNQATLRAR